jgi:hypothetical protein
LSDMDALPVFAFRRMTLDCRDVSGVITARALVRSTARIGRGLTPL